MIFPDLLAQIDDYSDPKFQCFLCGEKIEKSDDEHVIPRWAQERYDLWNQRLNLLNGTSIPYRQITVPCCFRCNNGALKPLEDEISRKVEEGREAVLAIDSRKLFLWLGKIFFGILYKELTLLADRSNPLTGTIVTPEFIKLYKMHRFFLQQTRGLVDFQSLESIKDPTPGSIFVFDMQDLSDRKMKWDLVDNIDTLFIGIRIGKVAILGSLGDGGAQQYYENNYRKFYNLPLHPVQFRELCSVFSYQSSLATRTPKYVTIQSLPSKTIQLPLGGLSTKALFDDWNLEDYAKILSTNLGLPIDQVFQSPDQVKTWLEDENRNPVFMNVEKFGIPHF